MIAKYFGGMFEETPTKKYCHSIRRLASRAIKMTKHTQKKVSMNNNIMLQTKLENNFPTQIPVSIKQ